jgi:hypothetical protein
MTNNQIIQQAVAATFSTQAAFTTKFGTTPCARSTIDTTRKADGIRRRWCKSSAPHKTGAALMGNTTNLHNTRNSVLCSSTNCTQQC